jgi:hypothetical protein
MSLEKYNYYEFKIVNIPGDDYGWIYQIYGDNYIFGYSVIVESDEYFDTEQQARFAAIGHIDLLENGEG